MSPELDKKLCEKYPKIMVNRNKPMNETAMCWGFDCGDGWYNILNQLMANIQHHCDWKEEQRIRAIEHNEMVEKMKAGDFTDFDEMSKTYTSEYKEIQRTRFLLEGNTRKVPDAVPQVTLDQVKEKFGTLRFYYTGGDDYIRGLVSMAEAMSGVTCEQCGAPGELVGSGWLYTACDAHTKEEHQGSNDL
jgi:hypothetical protein